jgi:hypothetical protein
LTPEEKAAYDAAFKKAKLKLAAKQGAEDAKEPPPPKGIDKALSFVRKALKESGAV